MSFNPTTQQVAFLDELLTGTANIALVARAGCGKTSSIMLAVDALVKAHPRAEIALCAYNKAIADEMKEELQERGHTNWKLVNASTMHSMGFGLLKWMFKPTIDDKKVRNLVRAVNDPFATAYGAQIEKLVATAKQEGFGFFDDRQIGDIGAWYNMADHYDINGFEDTSDMDRCIEIAQQVYRRSLQQTDVIDFDDMILFPLVKNLRVRFQKDFLFIDEAQDLSRARQALARKFVKPNGRYIVVGDDRQAIYGFSGADADALSNMKQQLRCVELPLSVTWRCPKAVVALAQTIVPDIEAAPNAKDGTVADVEDLPADLAPGDAILCRNTAPLVETAFKLIRKQIPVKVEGRDIGQGLLVLVNRWKVQSIDKWLSRLEDYREREVQKALAKDKEQKADSIADKCETLRVIADGVLANGGSTVDDIRNFIETLFADGDERSVILATYHRSKGREWPRVILINHEQLCPSPWAHQEWQVHQENNLAYVAFTRAQDTLLFWNF